MAGENIPPNTPPPMDKPEDEESPPGAPGGQNVNPTSVQPHTPLPRLPPELQHWGDKLLEKLNAEVNVQRQNQQLLMQQLGAMSARFDETARVVTQMGVSPQSHPAPPSADAPAASSASPPPAASHPSRLAGSTATPSTGDKTQPAPRATTLRPPLRSRRRRR
jgi:hypothetical protein